MTPDNRRRRYSPVDRSHQYRFLALVLAYNVLIVFFLGLCLFLPDILRIQDPTLSLEMRAAAADRILSMHARVWPSVIALLCLIGIHSFRVFHRLIGPLYRFRWAFEQIRSGNLGFRIRLRRKDYLHREEEGFNEMLDALAEKVEGIRKAGAEALRSLQEAGLPEAAAPQERMTHVRRHLETLLEELGSFRLQEGPSVMPAFGGPPAAPTASDGGPKGVEAEFRNGR